MQEDNKPLATNYCLYTDLNAGPIGRAVKGVSLRPLDC